MSKKKDPRKYASFVFWFSVILYFILMITGIVFCEMERPSVKWLSKPFMAGIITGGLFVLIAIYYFYNKYLLPYLHEDPKPEKGYNKGRIYMLMAVWAVPPLILQCFVIMGFLITIHRSPLSGNIYVNPYRYGQIFKKLDKFNQTELNMTVFTQEGDTTPWKGKQVLLDEARQYINQSKFKELFQGKQVEPLPSGKSEENSKTITNKAENALIERIIYRIPFLIAIAFSFLGVLVYSLQDAAHRLHTSDLYPRTFVSYLIRFIFALCLSISIAYFLMDDWWTNFAPVLFFLIGFFPQRALQFLEEKAMELLKLRKGERHEIPLGLVQGMTEYKIYRFREIGVGDVQNLANVDIDYLRQNLSYNDRLLCDFIAQALLIVYTKSQIQAFRDFGIRDILTFKNMVTDETYDGIAKSMNIKSERLKGLLDVVRASPISDRIKAVASCIAKATEKENKEARPDSVGFKSDTGKIPV